VALAYSPALEVSDSPSLDPTERSFVPSGGGGSPPVSCAYTLTGANAGTYGMSAPTIDGQRFYVSPTASATNYFCNSVETVSDWSSGIRWVEITNYSAYDPHVNTHAGIMDGSSGLTLCLQTSTSGGTTNRVIRLHNLITDANTTETLISAGTGPVSLGIDGNTGAAYYDIGAGAVALSGGGSAFSATTTYILAGRINGDGTNSAGATFVTAASSFTNVASGSDLCGNAV